MTKEEARKAAEVMLAYAEGKNIEFSRWAIEDWQPCANPTFQFGSYRYRIQSKPKYRPFKDGDECFEYSALQPFDKVLVRDGNCQCWRCAFFSCMSSNGMLCECRWGQGIPYNDETKHLLGTTDMPDEKYIWWE